LTFELLFTKEAEYQLTELENNPSQKTTLKAVQKTLGFMEINLKHPSLQTHEFQSLEGPRKEKVFESYTQNRTSGAYRIFWYYGPSKEQLTIMAIVPHP
jgi:hypothetical protein